MQQHLLILLSSSSNQCLSANSDCAYSYAYVSNDTSTSGILVEDVLHLITDDDQSKAVDALVTFGCGKNETGTFLEGAAPNGLIGLGLNNISVPSTLARNGLGPNSFSMCFGSNVIGRINFGDNGTSDQKETPFTVEPSFPTYNITITQINIGGVNVSQVEFNAIFDSGTSFTLLSDPAYTFISESFNSHVTEKRYPSDSQIPFEYCYYLSAKQIPSTPTVNLTMKGGDQYFVTDPIVLFSTQAGYFYCLGLLKSEGINIIGQNFMTGYRIVFNHDKMVLGWKASNCYNDSNSQTSPTNSSQSPALAVNPKSTAPSSHSPKMKAFTYALVMLLVSFFAIV
ncbi:aspartyl protease family protein 1 [Quercus suber]|uniref:Aspartyl protease family protein 1 n=1 Tax=Quercus suber TaxID=58331 RepID=A0AAW0M9F0_QUESU